MADGLDFYINMLANNAGALSAISSLQSLDATVKKNDASIKALETSYKDAVSQASKTPIGQGKWAENVAAVRAAEDKLAQARQKQALAVAKQDIYKKGLDKQVEGVRAAQAAEAARASQSKSLLGALENIKGSLGGLAEQAKGAGGPVGSLVGKLEGLGRGGTVGVAFALVAALGALAVAGAYAAAKMTSYAFAASDAARSSRLLSEAALGSASAGDELEAVVGQMSNLAPGLAGKLKEVGRELGDLQIRGRDAQRVLNTFGIVASAGRSAENVKQIAEASRMAGRLILGARDRFGEFASLKGTGVKAADIYAAVAKSMKTSIPEAERAVKAGLVPFRKGLEALELAAETKLGGNVARQLMSLSAQSEKLKENVGKIFGGANIEPFLAGLKKVTDLFDTNTVTGYVLREAMTLIFTKVASVVSKVFPYVQAAIQGVVMGILITINVAKGLYAILAEKFGGATKGIDGVMLAFKIGAGLVGVFVGSIVALTASIAVLGLVAVVALAPLWVPFALLGAVIYGAVKAVLSIGESFKSLGKTISGIDLSKAAGNMIDGLINGIKAKIGEVKNAILEVSGAITGAFASDQEIKSPGRKAMRQGKHVVEGHAIGMERNAPMAERASLAVSQKVTRGLEGGDSPATNGQPQSSNGPTFSFSNCTFGAVTQQELEEMLAIAWAKMARGYAAS